MGGDRDRLKTYRHGAIVRGRWSKEELDRLGQLWQLGYGVQRCAKILGRNPKSIRRQLRALGLCHDREGGQ